MNIPKELQKDLDKGTVQVDQVIRYEPGQVITNKQNETFTLIERISTYPTKGKWALARWRVDFKDRYGKSIDKDDKGQDLLFYRPITELGIPNENFPDEIPGLDWVPKDDNGEPREDYIAGATRSMKQGRGRPEGNMTELKARNIFRDIAKGVKEYDEDRIAEAKAFIENIGDTKFIVKYDRKFKEKGIIPLD
jgi:hypothetical protein